MGVFVLLYTDLSICLPSRDSSSYMYIYSGNEQTDKRLYIHTTHLCTPSASCIMPYAVCIYMPTHTHTYTCTRYLSTVHAISPYACMRVWSVGLCEWLGTGNKRREEREAEKKRCKRISRCILHCTALHGLYCTVALSSRLASPGLALHRIASFRPVNLLIPTSYLYFLGGSAGQSPRRLLTLHYLYVA